MPVASDPGHPGVGFWLVGGDDVRGDVTYPVATDSGDRGERSAPEQAALRRIATLVAEGAQGAELFAAVVDDVARVLARPAVVLDRYEPDGATTVLASSNVPGFPAGSRWPLDGPSLAATIFETGRSARIDDYSALPGTIGAFIRAGGFSSALGAPIIVDGTVWGLLCVGTTADEPLPPGTEDRLRDFTELVAIAVSNAQSRDGLRRLADQEAALRRVATLVAKGATPGELFSAVADEVAGIVDVSLVAVARYESDSKALVVASRNAPGFPVGSRWPLDGPSLFATVFETGASARIDDYTVLPGQVAAAARASGVESGVGVPIVVDGNVWGIVVVGRKQRRDALPVFTGSYTGRILLSTASPLEIEARLAAFTELVGTAISKTEAHEALRRLAEEQAALRRVATLVAEGGAPDEIFFAVAEEVARIFGLQWVGIMRYEPGDSFTVVATWGDHPFPVGSRWPLDGPSTFESVFRTGRPARIADYADLPGTVAEAARSAGLVGGIGAPIVVDGGTWGVIAAPSTKDQAIPEGLEVRLSLFTELVATAISNLQAHDDLRSLASEQAALRRVATLVAEGAEPAAIFDAVCAETGRLIGAASVNLCHYTDDGFNVTMAGWSLRDIHVPVGARFRLTPDTVGGVITRTRAPARVDSWDGAPSELARLVRERGIRSSVGAPVVVEGQLWGALVAATDKEEPLPARTELRLARFTELIASAISKAAIRAQLIASRARIVASGDEARRRFERNLHDGTQQRLLALHLDLQRVRAMVANDPRAAELGLEEAGRDVESVLEELRDLSRGLHPAHLSRGGLGPALRALAARSSIHVEVDVDADERPPASIETAVYYVVSEGITNAIKHSRASAISVTVARDQAVLRATIADDGVGGAVAEAGSGLVGLHDRVEALGGRLLLESLPGRGTTIAIELPIAAAAAS